MKKSIIESFKKVVKTHPAKRALFEKGRSMTYEELDNHSDQLALRILNTGVEKEEMIGVPNKKSIEFVIGVLAILKAGCCYVPLDESYPEKRLRFIVKDTKMNYALSFKGKSTVLNQLSIGLIDFSTNDYEMHRKKEMPEISPSNLAYVIYTSGSTGNPKGVMIEHNSVVNLAVASEILHIENDTVVAQFSNPSFDAATYEIWGALLNGACLYMMSDEYTSFDDWKYAINNGGVHIAFFTTGLFQAIVDEDPFIFNGLKKVIVGGDKLSSTHSNLFKRANPGTSLINGYGPTECTTFSLCYEVLEENQSTIPIGYPLKNVEIKIFSKEGIASQDGEVGEIYIGGEGLMRGYLNQPALTEDVFYIERISGKRWYKTGDFGVSSNSQIFYKGRKDNQVKIRGYRIELHEIQEKLDQFTQIKQAVVTVKTINEEKYIVVYYKDEEGNGTEQALKEYLKDELPHYMIPQFYKRMAQLPLNSNGKVDKHKLLDVTILNENSSTVLEENETKQAVLTAWQRVLKNEHFGMNDHFFEHGGHSILATKLVYVMREKFFPEATLPILLENFTVDSFVNAMLNQSEETIKQTMERDAKLSESMLNRISGMSKHEVVEGEILLTGATGFLGAHLLYTLLTNLQNKKIHCLVRFPSKGRLKKVLQNYRLWKEEFNERIVTIEGDFSKSKFGLDNYSYEELAKHVSRIYHIGAETNFFEPYHKAKHANIYGVNQIIELATDSRPKHIYYASTLSILTGDQTWDECTDLIYTDDLIIGYSQSKWVAEKLLLQAKKFGAFVDIFRLGRISSNGITGIWNESDMLYKVFESFVEQRMVPFQEEIHFELMPVDFVSNFIYKVSTLNQNQNGDVYHLFNSGKISSELVIEFLQKYNVTFTNHSLEEWLQILKNKTQSDEFHSLSALSQLIDESTKLKVSHIDQSMTLDKIEELALRMPDINYDYVELFLSMMLKNTLANR